MTDRPHRLALVAAASLWSVAACTTFTERPAADPGGLAELPVAEVSVVDTRWDGGEGDGEAEAEAEADAEADSGADTEADSDSAADTEADTEADSDSAADSDSGADSDSDAEADSEADTEADSEADSEPDSGADSEPDSGADSESDSDSDSESDSDSDSAADADADPGPDPCGPGRVSLSDGAFRVDGAVWRPRMVGYSVEVRRPAAGGPEPWFIAPHWQGCDDLLCCSDTLSCLDAIGADLDRAVLMGFDAVRLTGLDFRHPGGGSVLGCVSAGAPAAAQKCDPLDLDVLEQRDAALDLITGVLELATARELRVMLSVGQADFATTAETTAHASLLSAIAARFADDPTLFAYEVVEAVPQPVPPLLPTPAGTRAVMASWYQAIRSTGAPQLVTLGLGDSGASVSFDAASLPVDFLGYHPHPLGGFDAGQEAAYLAELTWLSETGRPFMVTATGFASDAWGTESEQVAFAQKSMVAARDCGALGYGWGQLRDTVGVKEGGLGAVAGDGSLKPVAGIFKAIDLNAPGGACPAPPAGLNPTGANAFQVSGRLIDGTGKSVPMARITGWTCPVFAEQFHTFSGPDGKFTLRSTAGLVQVAISGTAKVPITTILPKCLTKSLGDTIVTASPGQPGVAPPACP